MVTVKPLAGGGGLPPPPHPGSRPGRHQRPGLLRCAPSPPAEGRGRGWPRPGRAARYERSAAVAPGQRPFPYLCGNIFLSGWTAHPARDPCRAPPGTGQPGGSNVHSRPQGGDRLPGGTRRRHHGLPDDSAAPGTPAQDTFPPGPPAALAIGPDWNPRWLDSDSLGQLEQLVWEAADAGVFTSPPGIKLRLYTADDSAGGMFLVSVSSTTPALGSRSPSRTGRR